LPCGIREDFEGVSGPSWETAALGQITKAVVVVSVVVIDGFEGLLGGVEVVAVVEFVGQVDGGAPAFEDGMVAVVVLGVGVGVEVGAVRLGGGGLSLPVVPEGEAGEPLLEEGFRRGDGLRDAAQGFGKEEESGVIVMTGFAALLV